MFPTTISTTVAICPMVSTGIVAIYKRPFHFFLPREALSFTLKVQVPQGWRRVVVVCHIVISIACVVKIATVYLDGVLSVSHISGYTPFCADVASFFPDIDIDTTTPHTH